MSSRGPNWGTGPSHLRVLCSPRPFLLPRMTYQTSFRALCGALTGPNPLRFLDLAYANKFPAVGNRCGADAVIHPGLNVEAKAARTHPSPTSVIPNMQARGRSCGRRSSQGTGALGYSTGAEGCPLGIAHCCARTAGRPHRLRHEYVRAASR